MCRERECVGVKLFLFLLAANMLTSGLQSDVSVISLLQTVDIAVCQCRSNVVNDSLLRKGEDLSSSRTAFSELAYFLGRIDICHECSLLMSNSSCRKYARLPRIGSGSDTHNLGRPYAVLNCYEIHQRSHETCRCRNSICCPLLPQRLRKLHTQSHYVGHSNAGRAASQPDID